MASKTENTAIEKLLREVEVLTDLVDTVERWKMQTWAKVNALGTRIEKAETIMRELIRILSRDRQESGRGT